LTIDVISLIILVVYIAEFDKFRFLKLDFVIRGNKGSLKATRNIGKKKWLIVIYKEVSKRDGFVITAYFLDTKPKGEVIWRQ